MVSRFTVAQLATALDTSTESARALITFLKAKNVAKKVGEFKAPGVKGKPQDIWELDMTDGALVVGSINDAFQLHRFVPEATT